MSADDNRVYRVLYLDHIAKLSGGEIALVRALSKIDKTRIDPMLLLGEEGPLTTLATDAGCPTQVLPLSPKIGNLRKEALGVGALKNPKLASQTIRYARQVAQIAKAQGFHIIHANSLKSGFYGMIASYFSGIPLVWHIRDSIDKEYLPTVAVHAVRSLARQVPKCVVANSFYTLRTLELDARGPRKSKVLARVVYDGLVMDNYPAVPTKGRGDVFRIVHVGRIQPWKGQHVLLEAAMRLKASGRKFQVAFAGSPIFGEDDYADRLTSLTKSYGLEGEVEFLGFVEDIPALLRSADLLAHTSVLPEPFGQVITEAMAARTLVIASAEGGPLEIIDDGETGLLVKPARSDLLAEKIAWAMDNPRRADSIVASAHRLVQSKFSACQTAVALEDVYRDVLVATTITGKRGHLNVGGFHAQG